MTPIHKQIDRLVDSGLHPAAVSICRNGDAWTSQISLSDWAPSDEVGDNLPHHGITIDRDNLPAGVSMQSSARWPDDVIELPSMSDEQAEALIAAVATYGLAPDWAAFAEMGKRPHRWLTKPINWLSEPIRSALLTKYPPTPPLPFDKPKSSGPRQ